MRAYFDNDSHNATAIWAPVSVGGKLPFNSELSSDSLFEPVDFGRARPVSGISMIRISSFLSSSPKYAFIARTISGRSHRGREHVDTVLCEPFTTDFGSRSLRSMAHTGQQYFDTPKLGSKCLHKK